MNERYRISIVSYLNSLPFLEGLKNHPVSGMLEMHQDVPAVCAGKLSTGQADIGLIPAATLPEINQGNIISDYCIGCDGDVYSVLLLSRVPLNQIERILLDHESRTSVRLVRILAEELWNIRPEWIQASPGYEKGISAKTAAVVIGDRAMSLRKEFPYAYDLGAAWKELTGLPFVFAVWTANRAIEQDFLLQFNEALREGIASIPSIISNLKDYPFPLTELESYLQHHIRYEFRDEQRKGLELFLSKLR